MEKEKVLAALFDGKVLRGHDTELRINRGQLQERPLSNRSWRSTSHIGWIWENFEIATDPVDFMTAWKDMSENGAEYQFENDKYYVENGFLFKKGYAEYVLTPPEPLKNKFIEGKWYKV